MSAGITIPEHDTEATDGPERARRTGLGAALGRWPVRIALLIIVVLWLIPTVGLLISSFRTRAVVEAEGWWTFFANPFDLAQWTLGNYRIALTQQGFGNAFLNSLAVTIPSTVIPITVATFAAYAFSWMRFKGRNLLFVTVVALIVIPLHMALIPVLRLYTQGAELWGITLFPQTELVGTFPAVWLAHTGFALPLAIYLLRNYIGSLPGSVIESGKVDGASDFQVFTRLVVPLSVPAIAAFATLQFLWVWNDLLVALVFLGGTADVRVVTVALAGLQGQFGQMRHVLPAAAFISMVLPMVVFFSLQRYFIRGLTAGAVKG
jgi:alpha-glucoside transport system permease protein